MNTTDPNYITFQDKDFNTLLGFKPVKNATYTIGKGTMGESS